MGKKKILPKKQANKPANKPAKKPLLKKIIPQRKANQPANKPAKKPLLKKPLLKKPLLKKPANKPAKEKKKPLKKAKAVLKKAATKAKRVANKGKEAAMLAVFLPFKPLAKVFLKRRGITPAKDTKALALQVYNESKKKSFGYGGQDSFDFGMSDPHEYGLLDQLGIEHAEFGLIPVTPEMIQVVIMFLKNIFQKIKEKRAKGEPLTAEEQEIANQAGEIEKGLSEAKDKAEEAINESEKDASKIMKDGEEDAEKAANGGGIIDSVLNVFKKKKGGADSGDEEKGDEEKSDADGGGMKVAGMSFNPKILLALLILIALFFFMKK